MISDDIVDEYVSEGNSQNEEGNQKSRREKLGREHLMRIIEEDEEIGGVYVEITGSQGSGKTAVLLAMHSDFTNNYPQDRCFWASTYNAPLQFLKLGKDKYHIMILEGSNVEIRDREQNVEIVNFPNDNCSYPITYFSTFDELWDKSKPGMCNAIFFGDKKIWMDFLFYLRSKYEWAHIFIDEFSEVAPSDSKDVGWQRIRRFAEDIKEIRKCNKNVVTNSQTSTDVDYRVRRKIMIRIFLPGAKTDKKTRVYQRAVDNLTKDRVHGNMAYIDYDGKFGCIRFKNIFKPIKGINWEAHIVVPGEDEFGAKTITPRAINA